MKTLVIALLLSVLLVSASNVMAGGARGLVFQQAVKKMEAEQKRLDRHLSKIEAEADRDLRDLEDPAGSQTLPRRAVQPDSRLCMAFCPVTK